MTRPRRILLAVAIVVAGVSASSPAFGHGVSPEDPEPSNWEVEVIGGSRPSDGISFEVSGEGIVTLVNESPNTITVFGYEGEPYLRVGPDGTFENRHSPATYLNATTDGSTPLPDAADAGADPDWIHVSADRTATWHDHRTHWMGGTAPPTVRADPERRHVVIDRWEIPVVLDGMRTAVVGRLTWIPPPSPTPGVIAAALSAAAAFIAARTTAGLRVVGVASVCLVLIDAGGASAAVDNPPSAATIALLLPGVLLIYGLLSPRASSRRSGATICGIAGITVVLLLTHGGFLTNSQLPTALSPAIAQLVIWMSLGLGAGVVGCALQALARGSDARGMDRRLSR